MIADVFNRSLFPIVSDILIREIIAFNRQSLLNEEPVIC